MELFRILQQKKEQLPNTIIPFSDILARLCFVLECTPGDIIKYIFLFYYNTILHTDFRIRDDGSDLSLFRLPAVLSYKVFLEHVLFVLCYNLICLIIVLLNLYDRRIVSYKISCHNDNV